MKPFILALQFLTVITVRSDIMAGPGDLAASRNWYGVVGAVLGLILALSAAFLYNILPPLAAAAILVAAWGGLCRFLHVDGLADTADALVHTTSKERALEIMKDTHLGSFGLSAVVCVMLLKFGILASLSAHEAVRVLILAPALARALAAGLSVLLPPASPGKGLGALVGERHSLTPLFASGATALGVALVAGGMAGLVAAFCVTLLGIILGRWFIKRLGGVTGDPLGASIELGEAVALAAYAAMAI